MIDKSIIKRVLHDNREEVESYNVIHRDIDTGGFDCCVFVGVRRAGKSFVLYEKMQNLLASGLSWNQMVYLSFEDERLDGFDVNDFSKIIECHLEMGGDEKPHMFLDEVQNIIGWEKYARRLADTKYKVWITGSNAKMLSKEVMTTLGGRHIAVEIYPYSFPEYLYASGESFNPNTEYSTVGKSRLMRRYAEYMRWGGLPETVGMDVKRSYLSSVYQKIYLGDVCSRNKISNPNLMRLMIRKMAESVKQPISYSRLMKILSSVGGKISTPTTISYIGYCEDAWILLRLRNVSSAFSDKETNCKYYFVDNGLLSLMLIDADTALLENMVALCLFRRYGHDSDNERVFFYNSGIEVDFYVPEEGLAIQVAYSLTKNPDTMKRETAALSKLPDVLECKRRIIITYDEEREIEDGYGTIEVLPYWKFAII